MKYLYIALGFVCLGLGALGAALPILPTAPFLLATCFCFAKGSTRLNNWFLQTKLYQKNFKTFHENRSMTLKTKLTIMITVTITMSIGFIMMKEVLIGRIVLALVWLFHIYYFMFRIRTISANDDSKK